MNLDDVRAKWVMYSSGIHFRDEAEHRVSKEAFESAYVDGYVAGHTIGKLEGLAQDAINKAMKYE